MAKILIVDDEVQVEKLILRRFRRKIRSEEYHFEFALNGIEALEKLDQHDDIDIVLTDINMPKMDGLTFVSKLNEQYQGLKAVIVSAYGDMKNIRAAMNLGAYDFVTKPIDFQDLEATITKALKEIELFRIAEMAKMQLNLLQKELAVASKIQQSILPQQFDVFPAEIPFDIYGEMIPAKEIGGDFYDFFWIDSERMGIVIGDVSGKGMPAALFMAISRTLIRAFGIEGVSPHECLQRVNTLLNKDNTSSMFVTVFYGVLNVISGELEYCSGGHSPSIVISHDGQVHSLDQHQNIALGIVEDFEFRSNQSKLEEGMELLLYTDGIPEAFDEDFTCFSQHKMEDYLGSRTWESPKELTKALIQEVQAFAGGAPQSDDITLMAIRRKAL